MHPAPPVPVLQTERLTLRGLEARDFEPYAAMLADPDTARFITRRSRPYSAAEVWAELAFLIGHWALRGYGMFAVEERATGRFVGRVGPLEPLNYPALEIAWALTPDARGRGFASEAAAATISWTFETLACERIISIIHPDNVASQRVAARLGERRTSELFTPFRESCEIWSLRREEWNARGRGGGEPPRGPAASD